MYRVIGYHWKQKITFIWYRYFQLDIAIYLRHQEEIWHSPICAKKLGRAFLCVNFAKNICLRCFCISRQIGKIHLQVLGRIPFFLAKFCRFSNFYWTFCSKYCNLKLKREKNWRFVYKRKHKQMLLLCFWVFELSK